LTNVTTLRLPAPDRFHDERPRDLHGRQPPWHRLAYIVQELPRALERLAPDLNVPADGRVLDFGCADLPYRYFFPATVDYVAADLPGNPRATAHIGPDGRLSDLASESFDAILSTQVLEHVNDPGVYLAECHRLLRPQGRMLISTHGMMFYHPDPVDYWRWTCAGLREQLARAGFTEVRFDGVMGIAATGFQMIQEAWYYRIPLRLRPLLALVLQTCARLADRIESPASRELNSMVFATVVERPALPS
jgi:SAM-dependent methyltransferase